MSKEQCNTKFVRARLAAFALLFAAAFGHAEGDLLAEADVTSVVQSYIAALHTGDVNSLRQIAGGQLLNKRRGVWESADYAQTLVDTYGNATMVASPVQTRADGSAEVSVLMTSPDFTITKTLTLSRINGVVRITDERVSQQ